MHFSALTIVAYSLVAAVASAPVKRNGAVVVAPVHGSNVANGNHVGVAHRGDDANTKIPIIATDILNCNAVEAAADLLAKLGLAKRDNGLDLGAPVDLNTIGYHNKAAIARRDDGINTKVPVTVQDILNCDTIDAANGILAELKLDLGLARRDGVKAVIPITATDILKELELLARPVPIFVHMHGPRAADAGAI